MLNANWIKLCLFISFMKYSHNNVIIKNVKDYVSIHILARYRERY